MFLISTKLTFGENTKDTSLYETIPPERNDFALKFRYYERRTSLIPHWHEHLELLFFLNGKCEFVTGGRTIKAEPGDLVVVNGSEVHSYIASEPTDHFCLIIYPAFFADVDMQSVFFQSLIQKDEYIKDAFRDIYEAYLCREVGSDMMQKSHAYRLMAHLMKYYRAEQLSQGAKEAHDRYISLLDRVKFYISGNYQRHITIDELARICYFSAEYFCRFFKKTTGRTALSYINEYRIEKAAVMLAEADDPIGDISARVGFEDLNYFSRVFKKVNGCSPSEYRKAHNKGDKRDGNDQMH